MATVALGVAFAMASVLLWAGLEKARNLTAVSPVFAQLGVPARSARLAAALVAGLEVAVALGLIFRPGSLTTLAGVLCLASAFAIAGLIASFRGTETIPCACFGFYGGGRLGTTQVAALPLWFACAALVWLGAPGELSYSLAVSSLAAAALAMATLRAFSAWKEWGIARADRQSAREMLVWLKR